jgi:hypothetical protein
MQDEDIDLSEVPEVTETASCAVVVFLCPQQAAITPDAFIIEYFKAKMKGRATALMNDAECITVMTGCASLTAGAIA